MVLTISVAMAVGFVLGRIWQIRCDLEQERADDFTPPTIGRIPTSCATAAGGRLYHRPSAMPARRDLAQQSMLLVLRQTKAAGSGDLSRRSVRYAAI
jgi:hypothetical protein